MKVLFDSNVWRIISLPQDFTDEIFIDDFIKIRQSIIENKIEAFLSETIFTIESIRKLDRKKYLSGRKPKFEYVDKVIDDNTMHTSITIGSGDSINLSQTPFLKKYFDAAVALGFKIVSLPRIGGMVNEDVDAVRHIPEQINYAKFLENVAEVVQKIEDLGAGMAQIESIGKLYNSNNWQKGLKDAPEKDDKKIIKVASEWSDGDSVAISIGLSCDFFCTRDQAKKSGSKSVLSKSNLKWLMEDYNFKTILPQDLAKLIS